MVSLEDAHKQGLVVGLKDVAGVANRRDIDDLLLNHPNTFNLLLIAFKEIKGEDVPWQSSIDPAFQTSQQEKMSFYQIAGIHGLPRKPWDNETGRKSRGKKEEGDPGYCVHGTPAFAPWHRPYLAMLEQSLYRQAENIVERFQKSTTLSDADKQAYKDALKEFRLPYWDYYRPRGGPVQFPGVFAGKTTVSTYDFGVPQIFTLPEVMVRQPPDNAWKSVVNPFYKYTFATGDMNPDEWGSIPSFKPNTDEVKRTSRWGGDKQTNVVALNNGINKIREDQQRVSMIMIEDDREGTDSYTNFLNFAFNGLARVKEDLQKSPLLVKTASIEGVHDNYHCFLGGYASDKDGFRKIGHMMCVPVAAFDPVFWFHHCNIDRLFAIWQASNPNHWFDDIPADHKIQVRTGKKDNKGDDIYELRPSGFRDLHKDNLAPFRKVPNTGASGSDSKWLYWTPDSARNTDTFGYSYADIDSAKYPNPSAVRNGFKEHYSWSRRLEPFANLPGPPEDMQPLPVEKAQCYQYNLASSLMGTISSLTVSMTTQAKQVSMQAREVFAQRERATVSREWFIDTLVDRMALDGAFTIFFIVGEVSGSSAAEWMSLPGYAGIAHIFAAPSDACDNCSSQAERGEQVTNTVSITSLLLDYVENNELQSMEPADVEPFLVKNLKWRIEKSGAQVESTRTMAANHGFRLGVSVKTSPLPGQDGVVSASFFGNDIIGQIIRNAS